MKVIAAYVKNEGKCLTCDWPTTVIAVETADGQRHEWRRGCACALRDGSWQPTETQKRQIDALL